jgi:hypothetical protein
MGTGPTDKSDNSNPIKVILDGLSMELPSERRSLNGIRSYLETVALEQQRILCVFSIDGQRVNLAQPLNNHGGFCRVDAETIALDEMPLQILQTAFQQTEDARERVESALALVLINDGVVARELWWNLVKELKDPVLTLSLMPDNFCGRLDGGASFTQLRKWQLQQIAAIIKDVDAACHAEDTTLLSNALENHVLPWLQSLRELIMLWHRTASAGARLGIQYAN